MAKKRVPTDNYQRFHYWLVEMSDVYGMWEDPDVKRALLVLFEKIQEHLGKSMAKQDSQKIGAKVFAIFKQKYLESYDIEYQATMGGGAQMKIAEGMVEKLEKQGASIEEYMNWLFDDFFAGNDKLSPGLPLALSNNVLQSFFYQKKTELKKRQIEKKAQDEGRILLQEARVLLRETNDEALVKVLGEVRDGKAGNADLRRVIDSLKGR